MGADLLVNAQCARGTKPAPPSPPQQRRARSRASSGPSSREWWRPSARAEAHLHHYAGGKKPENMLLAGQACDRSEAGRPLPAHGLMAFYGLQAVQQRLLTSGGGRPAAAKRRGGRGGGGGGGGALTTVTRLQETGLPPERHVWEVARALAWGLRALDEVQRMKRGVHQLERAVQPAAANGAGGAVGLVEGLALEESEILLETGTECMNESLWKWQVTVTPWFRKFLEYKRRPLATQAPNISAGAFMGAFYPNVHDSIPKWPSIFGSR